MIRIRERGDCIKSGRPNKVHCNVPMQRGKCMFWDVVRPPGFLHASLLSIKATEGNGEDITHCLSRLASHLYVLSILTA